MKTTNEEAVEGQLQETVYQEMKGVTIRMAFITCPGCGWKEPLIKTYRCLYCKIWFCETCAENHFGKYNKERDSNVK